MKPKPRKIIVLGATGSIGRQTLDCVEEANRRDPGKFIVTGLSSNTNIRGLLDSGTRFPTAALALQGSLETGDGIRFTGPDAVSSLLAATEADLVVNGISGSSGLLASVRALSSGKNLALANKESVVMGYSHMKALAEKHGLSIIPVDSEHAALFQLISRIGAGSVAELTITASGGPFRMKSAQELAKITPDEAARHPVWKMGRKISIDSATLANKGLELIEAVRLFGVPENRVKILIHPESLVHALVRTVDGALYAHMSSPDMRLPINIALHWPEEVPCPFGRLDLAGKTLHFEEPDTVRFPMLNLAREAVSQGEAATIAYNAADEIAVDAFESGSLRFTGIPSVVAAVLEGDWAFPVPDVDSIFVIDARARAMAHLAVTEYQC
jgi:1-deoxy-D-xylulose-5-phosphate reductoisomerase